MQKYEDLEPKKVFYWFKQLNDIPRGSGNEEAVSDFLVSFAKERELEVYQDALNNVIIKKEATEGYEKILSQCTLKTDMFMQITQL